MKYRRLLIVVVVLCVVVGCVGSAWAEWRTQSLYWNMDYQAIEGRLLAPLTGGRLVFAFNEYWNPTYLINGANVMRDLIPDVMGNPLWVFLANDPDGYVHMVVENGDLRIWHLRRTGAGWDEPEDWTDALGVARPWVSDFEIGADGALYMMIHDDSADFNNILFRYADGEWQQRPFGQAYTMEHQPGMVMSPGQPLRLFLEGRRYEANDVNELYMYSNPFDGDPVKEIAWSNPRNKRLNAVVAAAPNGQPVAALATVDNEDGDNPHGVVIQRGDTAWETLVTLPDVKTVQMETGPDGVPVLLTRENASGEYQVRRWPDFDVVWSINAEGGSMVMSAGGAITCYALCQSLENETRQYGDCHVVSVGCGDNPTWRAFIRPTVLPSPLAFGFSPERGMVAAFADPTTESVSLEVIDDKAVRSWRTISTPSVAEGLIDVSFAPNGNAAVFLNDRAVPLLWRERDSAFLPITNWPTRWVAEPAGGYTILDYADSPAEIAAGSTETAAVIVEHALVTDSQGHESNLWSDRVDRIAEPGRADERDFAEGSATGFLTVMDDGGIDYTRVMPDGTLETGPLGQVPYEMPDYLGKVVGPYAVSAGPFGSLALAVIVEDQETGSTSLTDVRIDSHGLVIYEPLAAIEEAAGVSVAVGHLGFHMVAVTDSWRTVVFRETSTGWTGELIDDLDPSLTLQAFFTEDNEPRVIATDPETGTVYLVQTIEPEDDGGLPGDVIDDDIDDTTDDDDDDDDDDTATAPTPAPGYNSTGARTYTCGC